MVEAGLRNTDFIVNRASTDAKYIYQNCDNEGDIIVLGLNHLQSAFYLLILGSGVGFLTFFVETIPFSSK